MLHEVDPTRLPYRQPSEMITMFECLRERAELGGLLTIEFRTLASQPYSVTPDGLALHLEECRQLLDPRTGTPQRQSALSAARRQLAVDEFRACKAAQLALFQYQLSRDEQCGAEAIPQQVVLDILRSISNPPPARAAELQARYRGLQFRNPGRRL